jgi:UDP-N-acetylglucosamine 2-epimerase (non-hydrolysing)
LGSIRTIEPLGYPQLVQALGGAQAVVTDSGGLQKEAFLLGVPTSTVRTETEWVETLGHDWNVLVADPKNLPDALARPRPTAERGSPYGDGQAAAHAIDALRTWR